MSTNTMIYIAIAPFVGYAIAIVLSELTGWMYRSFHYTKGVTVDDDHIVAAKTLFWGSLVLCPVYAVPRLLMEFMHVRAKARDGKLQDTEVLWKGNDINYLPVIRRSLVLKYWGYHQLDTAYQCRSDLKFTWAR